jgi:FAD:protein FMN transferase
LDSYLQKSFASMGTVITLKATREITTQKLFRQVEQMFYDVESKCSRFVPDSELMELSSSIGVPVRVSDLLFEIIRFGLTVSANTNGIFDITVGKKMETNGFNEHYLTKEKIAYGEHITGGVSYKDIFVDEINRTILIQKPLILDLGALAKGMTIDLAAKILSPIERFLINAGGDIYAKGGPWKIGIQHPEKRNEYIIEVDVSDQALCTSGGYERRSTVKNDVHHIIDPITNLSPTGIISATVLAPFAMLADAYSTVSMLLGKRAISMLNDLDLDYYLIDQNYRIYRRNKD